MKMGREEEARSVLKATREGDVERELKGIKKVVKFELETSTSNHYWAMVWPKDKYAGSCDGVSFLLFGFRSCRSLLVSE